MFFHANLLLQRSLNVLDQSGSCWLRKRRLRSLTRPRESGLSTCRITRSTSTDRDENLRTWRPLVIPTQCPILQYQWKPWELVSEKIFSSWYSLYSSFLIRPPSARHTHLSSSFQRHDLLTTSVGNNQFRNKSLLFVYIFSYKQIRYLVHH